MKLNPLHALFLLLLLSSACAPRTAQMVEVALPPQRIPLQGYSLLPLNEEGWFLVGGNEQQIALGKQGSSPDETRMIQAMLLSLPTFSTPEDMASWVKEGQARDTDPRRFTVRDHDVSPAEFNGATCTRSAMTAEDRQAVKRTDTEGPMVLEVLAQACVHPLDRNIGVYVIYSHRYYPGHQDGHLADKADELFQAIEFTGP
jgi:hypothetical protein